MAVVVSKPRSLRDQVSPEEWAARVDLACAYRLVAHHGWTWMIYNHISARVPGHEHQFLLNPFGLHYTEVTASNLVKIDLDGKILDGSPYPINDAGFTIHSAIHGARPDVAAVLHTHTEAGGAVSALEAGLLPFSQDALLFYNRIAYHDFEGIALDLDERSRLVRDLGPHFAMILRNHGLLTIGRSAAEAFLLMYRLESACRIQVMAQSGGSELSHIDSPILSAVRSQVDEVTKGMGAEILWPGLLRRLDRLDGSYKE